MILRALVACGLVLVPTLAAATPLTLAGSYDFQSTARQDSHAVCRETWSFAEGVQTIASGQEVTRSRFRIQENNGLSVLVAETFETNGAPDCLGRRSAGPTPGTRRILLIPFNDGTIQVCPPPPDKTDGQFVIGDCIGALRPVQAAN